jgi:Icc-related predicted phosphoesterase
MLTVYYASDIHGSESLWRKFLNAGPFYKADVLIMGGDICGKGIVPIVARVDGNSDAVFMGRRMVLKKEEDVVALESDIRFNGMYPYRCSAQEFADASAHSDVRDVLFERLMENGVERWLRIGDEKLSRSGVPCYVMPGNDDSWVIDKAFSAEHRVRNCDQQVIDLGDGYSLASSGYSNRTPWDSPRELSEEDLENSLETLVAGVHDQRRSIFNFHVPPYGSELDTAALLDSELRPRKVGGQPVTGPVGSTAVRSVIERHQPLMALHGHIHEAKGAAWIGRTLCLNPGSNYNTGRLDGVLVQLENEQVKDYQFVSG